MYMAICTLVTLVAVDKEETYSMYLSLFSVDKWDGVICKEVRFLWVHSSEGWIWRLGLVRTMYMMESRKEVSMCRRDNNWVRVEEIAKLSSSLYDNPLLQELMENQPNLMRNTWLHSREQRSHDLKVGNLEGSRKSNVVSWFQRKSAEDKPQSNHIIQSNGIMCKMNFT